MFEPKVEEKEAFDKIWPDRESLGLVKPKDFKSYLFSKGLEISEQTLVKWIDKKNKAENGFDVRKFLEDNKESIARAALKAAEDGKPKALDTVLTMLGELSKEKKEAKVERTNADIRRDSEKFLELIREGLERDGGICPVCKRPNIFLNDIRQDKVH
jgi:hypothetical protein